MTTRSWPMLSFLPTDLADDIVEAFVFGGAGNEALVTLSSGDIYALGFNGNGCLGIGNSCSTMEPQKVEVLSQKKITGLAFGSGPHVLAVTDSGELYSWGHWGYGQLGHTDPDKSTPTLVKANIGKKKIRQIACGSYHSVSMTSDGEVYSWGSNNCGQLGMANTSNQAVPVKVEGLLGVIWPGRHLKDTDLPTWSSPKPGGSGRKIFGLLLGGFGGMLVSSDLPRRTVVELLSNPDLSFNYDLYAYSKKIPVYREILVMYRDGGGISGIPRTPGQTGRVGRSEDTNGKLYSWGYNGNGQLGIKNTTNQPSPCKVSFGKTIIISKVMCGMAHVLALSDIGELYSWGANSYGQIGIGTTMNAVVPTLIPAVEERWSDIAAHHYNHISSAITITGNVFMWGQCHGLTLLSPRKVAVASLDQVFACFGMPQIMFRPVKLDYHFGKNSVTETIKTSFDDKDTGDLTFIIEGRSIHVHKAILKIRCDYFRSMLQSHWEESNKREIEITDFSYVVYRAFLRYLYSDEVQIAPDDAIGLLDLAHVYCETNLKQKCQNLIKQSISVENCSSLMDAAIQYHATDLENFCFSFMVSHLTAVTQTEAFKNLDGEIVKKIIIKAGFEQVQHLFSKDQLLPSGMQASKVQLRGSRKWRMHQERLKREVKRTMDSRKINEETVGRWRSMVGNMQMKKVAHIMKDRNFIQEFVLER
eukprot:gene18363-20209_t